MMERHTATPWKITKNESTRLVFLGNGARSYPLFTDDPDFGGPSGAFARDWEHAAFIVKACNSHSALYGIASELRLWFADCDGEGPTAHSLFPGSNLTWQEELDAIFKEAP